ncbi:MAG: hypothetical protein M9899_03390 [Bdellovibrionaceae bacterium]|nr:hypothetical protein [Pseudobdellovibrionaceae bacterium]
MSDKQVQNSFLPRFIVSEFKDRSEVANKAATDKAATDEGTQVLLTSEMLHSFKDNLMSAPQVELGVICFENVSEEPALAEMLDKLVMAVKQNDYQMYQFPKEVQNKISVDMLETALSEVESLPHNKILIFDSKSQKTQNKDLGNCKLITTYGLTDLSQSVQYKKDLWTFLQKHF